MDCNVILQLSNYDFETNQIDKIEKPLGKIESDKNLDIDYVVDLISKLPIDDRRTLAAQLRAAKVQKVTEEMLKKYQFVSNISLEDLTSIFSNLKNYQIPTDLNYKFTLLNCRSFKVNGQYYHGKITHADTKEDIYIVTNRYDAEKLFKHLAAKLNLSKFVQGNTLDDKLKPFEEDLKVVSSKYNKNIQKLIEDFLVNKKAYKPFKVENKLYNPTIIINKALKTLTGEVYDVGDRSELQMALEGIKEKGSTSNEWKLNKKKLYEILSSFNEEFSKTYTYTQFKDLNTEALNTILSSLFKDDVKLMRATVQDSIIGEKVIKESLGETKTRKLSKEVVEQFYKNRVRTLDESLPKTLDAGLKKLGYDFITLLQSTGDLVYTDAEGNTYPIKVSMDSNYKVTMTYEELVKPTVKEKPSYVILNLHNWDPIGDVYGWSYEHKPLFVPEDKYKGFYIYKYDKDGSIHYAISRSIISPKSFMKTFSSLKYAKDYIDANKDTLRECGLWSIKQHSGIPRVTKLEMNHIREGQIITTLDIDLPNKDIDKLSTSVSDLLDKPLADFYERFNFVENIRSLETPEKAVAFLYLTHDLLEGIDGNAGYLKVVQTKKKQVQNIIKLINEAPTKSFYIDKANIYSKNKDNTGRKYENTYYLTLLRKEGVDVDLSGTFKDNTVQDFLIQNLTDLAEYYKNNLGVNIVTMTKSELEVFSKQNGLNLENKLDSVRAFVYNGTIYLNVSSAKATDLFHELAHILLGSLKASDFNMYSEIIKSYQSVNNFDEKLKTHRKTYVHYSYQDVLEETVADLIASDMYRLKNLGNLNLNEVFITAFRDVFKKSETFMKNKPDNAMGFSTYIKSLIDENSNDVVRNMRVTELIKRYISEGKIKEDCDGVYL